MIILTLPVPLARLVQAAGPASPVRPKSLELHAGNWPEVVGEMRERFPLLAERVLNAAGGLVPGFVLVINDQAMPASGAGAYEVADGDEIAMISALAGG
jgi:molybdopterin converting factor small subunit